MKKVELEKNKTPVDNWDNPQWVIFSDKIVLTTGQHGGNSFSGTALPCSSCPLGEFSDVWDKRRFSRLNIDIPFIISNED